MARLRTMRVAAVNIRAQPHSSKIYKKLMDEIFSLKQPVNIRGSQYLLLSSITKTESEPDIISGSLARFTEIDLSQPWLDITTINKANDKDVAQVQIPEHLRPNYSAFLFYFDTKQHRFYFEAGGTGGSLSVNLVVVYLRKILTNRKIKRLFGDVLVDAITSTNEVAKIFNLANIVKLDILVKRTNPDDLSGYEAALKERLRKLGAKSILTSLDADGDRGIVADEELRSLGEVAAENGEVSAVVTSDSGRKTFSSLSHPRIESIRYDPEGVSEDQALRRGALKMQRRRIPRTGT